MTKLYLVTGFLGAGKTTFLKNFIKLFKNYKMTLIVNEFGKEGIDGQILSPLGIALEEINNGSIFCSCRLDKFEEVLTNTLKSNPEIIIVEASGLSDPTNIRKILAQPNKFTDIEYMGSICLIDCINFHKVYATARVCKKQLGISDIAILNKTDRANPEQIQAVKELISAQRPDIPQFQTNFGNITQEWIDHITTPTLSDLPNTPHINDINLHKLLIKTHNNFDYYNLSKFIDMFIEDTYRIKGFVSINNQTYLVNCVGNMPSIELFSGEARNLNELVVLYGYGLPAKKSVAKAVDWYRNNIISIE